MFSEQDSYGLTFRWVMKMAGDASLSRPYAQHPWVHACVSAIAKAVSSVPLVLQRRLSDGSYEPVESGPLYDLLAKPNKLMSQRKFLTSLAQTQQLYGETMLLMMEKKPNGQISYIEPSAEVQVPDELWPVRGDLLEEIIDEQTQLPRAWRMSTSKGTIEIPDESLIHVAAANPYNPIRGMGPMQAAFRTASKDFVLDRYDEALLQNSGSPGGILSVDGHLTDADQRAIADAWREAHGRPDSHRKTAVLPQGTKYEEIGFSPQEMEFQQMRDWNRETIMAIFGVTKPIIGLTEGLNYASSQSAFRSFWEVTVVPFLDFIADEMQTKFLQRLRGPESELSVGFDLSGVAALREDADSKVERALRLFTQGGRTFHEAADLAGWDVGDTELVNADEAYLPANMVPVGVGVPGEPVEEVEAPDEVPADEAEPEAAPDAPEKAQDPEATAEPSSTLNGAQISSLLGLIEAYASGQLPKDTVLQLIIAAFPFDLDRAERILQAVPEPEEAEAAAPQADSAAPQPPIPPAPAPEGEEEEDPADAQQRGLTEQQLRSLLVKVEQEELDQVYKDWRASVNMSASELRRWRDNPCSRKASLNPTAVIDRNLRLLETKKEDWDGTHVRAAKRTISFIARMRQAEQGEPVSEGCPSKRDISLRNWAFDPKKASRSFEPEPKAQALKYWEAWDRDIKKREDGIAKTTKRVLRDLMLQMRKRIREAADGPWVKGVPSKPPRPGFRHIATEAEIARLLDINAEAWGAEMLAALDPKITSLIIDSAVQAQGDLGGSALILSRTDPAVVSYMASKELVLTNLTTNIIDEVQRAIVRILASDETEYASLREAIWHTLEQTEAYMNGRLKGLGTRAQLIARTETTGAANFGRLEQFKQEGVNSVQWFAQPSARETHASLNGKEVQSGEEFGYGLRYPGDPNAPVGEIANCRCLLLPGKDRT